MSAPVAAAAGLALAYGAAAARARWPARRCAAFLAGLAALVGAAAVGDAPLARHMVEHSLLSVVAAPLLVLGAPLALALRTLPRRPRRALARLLHRPAPRALASAPVAWTLFVGLNWAFHVEPLFGLAQRHPLLHAAEHALFLASGFVFWALVAGRNPLPRLRGGARSAYLGLAMPAVALVGVWYLGTGRAAAGSAMIAGMIPLDLAFAAVTWRFAVEEHARTVRLEAYLDART